jgi:hypothetical protein
MPEDILLYISTQQQTEYTKRSLLNWTPTREKYYLFEVSFAG